MAVNLENTTAQPTRIAIVTGANSGLGFETAKVLAKKDMLVIMACRDLQKAEHAKKQLLNHFPDANIEIRMLDLASLNSVRAFADDFLSRYNRLDLLINNAGVMVPPYEITEDGYELQFQVNYLGHFLLTGLLLPLLIQTEKSRVVALSSKAHENARIHFEDLQSKNHYSRWKAYGQSKLACLIFARELDKKLKTNGYSTTAVAAHPGISNTELFRYFPKWFNHTLGPLLTPIVSHSPEKAVHSILYAALGNELPGGTYIGPKGFMGFKGKPGKTEPSKNAGDKEVAKRLWEVSEKLVGFPYFG